VRVIWEMIVSTCDGTACTWRDEEGDAQKEHDQDAAHPDQGDAGVAAARLFEGGDAVGDGLDAGQGGGAIG
jgi:hypothetical protein